MPPKRNAFFNFMVKRKPELEAQGFKFPGGWREVSLAVALEWSKMGAEEKKPFMPDQRSISTDKNSAPESDNKTDVAAEEAWDSETDSASESDTEESSVLMTTSDEEPERPTYDELTYPLDPLVMNAIKEGREEYFNNDIDGDLDLDYTDNTYGGKTEKQLQLHRKVACFESYLEKKVSRLMYKDNIPDMNLLLITFNTWCRTDEMKYIPSEVALLAFNMRKGIMDQYATPIDPGAYPPGYGYDASVQADELYFPVPPFDEELRDYPSLLGKINEFMEKHTNKGDPGYLFCLRKEMRTVYGCLQWMIKKAGASQDFELYPFEFLVMKLSKLAASSAVMRAEEHQEDSEDSYSIPIGVESLLSKSKLSEDESEAYFASVSGMSSNFSDTASVAESDSSSTCSSVSTVRSEASSTSTSGERAKVETEKIKNCFNSEEAVLLYIDRLIFGSMPFFGCLHHMFYSEVVHRCALNRLNRYAFQTLDLLILNFGIMPVNGANFLDTKAHNLNEMGKRQTMLENWGLRLKMYPGYTTPVEREQVYIPDFARYEAAERNKRVDEDGYVIVDPDVIWRRSRITADFIPMNPENDEEDLEPPVRPVRAYPSSIASSNVSVKENIASSVSTFEELFPDNDNDNDGWSYVEKR